MGSVQPHTTVLLEEAVAALVGDLHAPNAVFVDGTFGRGGHARRILECTGPGARLVAFDKDPQALASAAEIRDARFSIRQGSFTQLGDLPVGSVAGVLLDLGVSSPQIDEPERGFSFRFDGPLDMRMDPTRGESVAQWLAHAGQTAIAEVIRDYGEERFAGAIAKAIVARRENQGPVQTTAELAHLVAGAVRTRERGQNPATRTFQALRIFINAELEDLRQALEASLQVLAPHGRLVVISFHSLEDRIVKQFIARHAREEVDRHAPFAAPRAMPLKSLGRTKPGATEIAANARARSAVMRVAERTGGGGMTRVSIVLLLALMASSMWLVQVQYESRRLNTEWHRANVEARQLEVDRQRLLVEKRAQATPLRVERLAHEKLKMRTPTPATTLYVAADGTSLAPAVGGKP